MGLEREDGSPWWRRSGYQSLSQQVFDEHQPEPEPPAPKLWNSPCTTPDKPGYYLVTIGRYFDGDEDQERIAHWNGTRWSRPFSIRTYRDVRAHYMNPPRAFDHRQDYPWREFE